MKLVCESINDFLKPKTRDEILSKIEKKDVKFEKTNKSASGTWLIGDIHISYKKLVELFGKPDSINWNNAEWVLKSDKGKILRLYPYYGIGDYKDNDFWKIAGTDENDVSDLLSFIYLNSN